jgi:SAM-dependent methyltransferase
MSQPTNERSGKAEPSPWAVRFAPLIPPGGTVLDLACGNGRHVRFLIDRGHPVVALDRDLSKLGALKDAAGVEAIETDLEDGNPWPLAGRKFSGIIVANYLHRPLFPAIVAAVAAGGVLIYETFALGNERFGKPSSPGFLLRPGELLDAARGDLRVVAYEDGIVATPRRAAIQRLCAVRPAGAGEPPALPAPI